MLSSKQEIGKLDRRITLEVLSTSKDEYNQDIESWSTFRLVWAEIKDGSGNEQVIADQPTAVRITEMTIRYIAGVNEMNTRVKFGGQIYNIVGIQRPDRNRTLILRTSLSDEAADSEGGGFSATAFSSGFDN